MPDNEEHPLKKKLGDLIQDALNPQTLKSAERFGVGMNEEVSAVLTVIVQEKIWPEFNNLLQWVENLEIDRTEQLDLLAALVNGPDPTIISLADDIKQCEYCHVAMSDFVEFVHAENCPWLRAKKIVGGE